MATLIRVDGTLSTVKTDLASLQRAVGGYIEIVHVRDKLLIVDEEGALRHKHLNVKATRLAGRAIVGDVVLCESWEID